MTVILNIQLLNEKTETGFGELLLGCSHVDISALFSVLSKVLWLLTHALRALRTTSNRDSAKFFTYIVLNTDLTTTLSLTKEEKKNHKKMKQNYAAAIINLIL